MVITNSSFYSSYSSFLLKIFYMGNIIAYHPVMENGVLTDIYLEYKSEINSGYVIHRALVSEFLPGITLQELITIIDILKDS